MLFLETAELDQLILEGGDIFLEQLPYGFSGPQDIQFYQNHIFFDKIRSNKK